VGDSSNVVAAPVGQNGVAYLVGQANDAGTQRIAASSVCLFMPPACPSPETPTGLSVSPESGGNENDPKVRGVVPAGAAVTEVTIHTDAACAGGPVATGTEAAFEADGIAVSVPDNSTTTFYAKAVGVNGSSGCSAGVEYAEVTPPAATPQTQAAPPVAKKKCKKVKKKPGAKKRKCKKKRR
jgi:hypothetical protein